MTVPLAVYVVNVRFSCYEGVPWWNTAVECCYNVNQWREETEIPSLPRKLRIHAEDAPDSVIELEGRLRAVQVITCHATRSARTVHWNSVHVI